MLSLHGTEAWLYNVLQEGEIGCERWQNTGLAVAKDHAYRCYEDFGKRQNVYRPEIKPLWSKQLRNVLGRCVADTRQKTGKERVRLFQFKSLADCRREFANHIGAPDLEWEPDNEPEPTLGAAVEQTAQNAGEPSKTDTLDDAPDFEWEPMIEPEDSEWERVDEDDIEREPVDELGDRSECEPGDERETD